MIRTRKWIAPLLAAAVAFGPGASAAADPDWGRAQQVDVMLSSFKFGPKTLQLKAGQPVILHLVNSSSGGHDFSAPDFFAAAAIRPADRDKVARGRINLRGHESINVGLVPAAGRYKLKCTHAFHAMFGMTGSISVE